jgi:hypothetical protein
MRLAAVEEVNISHQVILAQAAADQVLVVMVVRLVDIMLLPVLLAQDLVAEVVLINTAEQAILQEQMVVVV